MSADNVANKLRAQGVFLGENGLVGLADANDFWENQPYGARLYYGPGIMDYLHRGVLRAAIRELEKDSAEA